MKEQWKWIKGYEKKYEISNTGKIRHTSNRLVKRELSLKNSKGSYFSVRLYDGKKWHTKRIHRLVYETFKETIPKGYHIHHIDANKQNNRLDNLQMLSASEHAKIAAHHPNTYKAMVARNRFCQKHILQYSLDNEFLKEYINAQEAGRVTNVCSRNILQVASKDAYGKNKRIRKQAGGYIWKFKKGVIK